MENEGELEIGGQCCPEGMLTAEGDGGSGTGIEVGRIGVVLLA